MPESAKRPTRSAFSSPVFRRYFGASCFSTFATWITRFLLGWTTWDLSHSAFWVGVVSAAMLLPTFLLSPLFGVVSDRISARNGMLATTSLQVVIGAGAAVVSHSGHFSLAWLVATAVGVGAVSSAHHPMRLALIPKLVDRDLLPSAIGLSAVVFNSSRIIGPAVAAWLVAQASVAIAFTVSASLFGGGLVFLASIPPLARGRLHSGRSLLADLTDGLRFVARHRPLKLVLALTMINGLVGRSVVELLPAISGQLVGGGAASLAILTGFAGFGSIIGGVVVARQPGSERRMIKLVLVCILGGLVVLLPVGLVATLPPLTLIMLLLSMTMTMVGTGCQTLIQLAVPDAYRGRVLSIWTVVTMGTPAFGAFALGASADKLGFGPVLALAAVAAILGALLLASRRHLLYGRNTTAEREAAR